MGLNLGWNLGSEPGFLGCCCSPPPPGSAGPWVVRTWVQPRVGPDRPRCALLRLFLSLARTLSVTLQVKIRLKNSTPAVTGFPSQKALGAALAGKRSTQSCKPKGGSCALPRTPLQDWKRGEALTDKEPTNHLDFGVFALDLLLALPFAFDLASFLAFPFALASAFGSRPGPSSRPWPLRNPSQTSLLQLGSFYCVLGGLLLLPSRSAVSELLESPLGFFFEASVASLYFLLRSLSLPGFSGSFGKSFWSGSRLCRPSSPASVVGNVWNLSSA